MKKLKLDYESISNYIDEAISDNDCITFICNDNIAQYIKDYVVSINGINKRIPYASISQNDNYVVTFQYANDLELKREYFECIIENIKNHKGEYKPIENIGTCYDLSDIDKNIILDIVDTYDLVFCEFVEEDCYDESEESDEECDCPSCQFEQYLGEQLEQAIKIISNNDTCEKCKMDALMNIFELGVYSYAEGFVDFDNDEDE
jgi:hypothetical protein